jgi:hypothetical protein
MRNRQQKLKQQDKLQKQWWLEKLLQPEESG